MTPRWKALTMLDLRTDQLRIGDFIVYGSGGRVVTAIEPARVSSDPGKNTYEVSLDDGAGRIYLAEDRWSVQDRGPEPETRVDPHPSEWALLHLTNGDVLEGPWVYGPLAGNQAAWLNPANGDIVPLALGWAQREADDEQPGTMSQAAALGAIRDITKTMGTRPQTLGFIQALELLDRIVATLDAAEVPAE